MAPAKHSLETDSASISQKPKGTGYNTISETVGETSFSLCDDEDDDIDFDNLDEDDETEQEAI